MSRARAEAVPPVGVRENGIVVVVPGGKGPAVPIAGGKDPCEPLEKFRVVLGMSDGPPFVIRVAVLGEITV